MIILYLELLKVRFSVYLNRVLKIKVVVVKSSVSAEAFCGVEYFFSPWKNKYDYIYLHSPIKLSGNCEKWICDNWKLEGYITEILTSSFSHRSVKYDCYTITHHQKYG